MPDEIQAPSHQIMMVSEAWYDIYKDLVEIRDDIVVMKRDVVPPLTFPLKIERSPESQPHIQLRLSRAQRRKTARASRKQNRGR